VEGTVAEEVRTTLYLSVREVRGSRQGAFFSGGRHDLEEVERHRALPPNAYYTARAGVLTLVSSGNPEHFF
jgi:hypothetical protein